MILNQIGGGIHRRTPSNSCSNFAIQSYCYRTKFQNASPRCAHHLLRIYLPPYSGILCIQIREVCHILKEFL